MSQDDITKRNLITAANLIELGRRVIENLSGEAFVAQIDGQSADKSAICELLAAKINLHLSKTVYGMSRQAVGGH